jgi:hypothetical protein
MIKYTYIKFGRQSGIARFSDDYTDIIPLIKFVEVGEGKSKVKKAVIDDEDYNVELVDYSTGNIKLLDQKSWPELVKFRSLESKK